MNYINGLKISLLIILLLAVAACDRLGLGKKVGTPVNSGNNPPASENQITIGSDPAEVIRKAYEKMAALRSCRILDENILSAGTTLTNKMEFVAPDRLRSVQTETGIETIMIGGDFYIKSSGSAWTKSDLLSAKKDEFDQGFAAGMDMFNKFLNDFSKSHNVKTIGPDTVDGTPVTVYQYTSSNPAQTGDETKKKLWIGTRDNLIYKFETEDNLKFGDKTSQMKSSMKFYDFGADIKIEPPI